MLELIGKLCSVPGISGREDAVRELIISEIKDFAAAGYLKNDNARMIS